jgi:hypothetical protein
MGLSGWQRKEIQEALVDAFPTKSSLEQMLSYELDKNLEAIAGSGSLQDIVFNLIKKAESEAWVEELITAACWSNPGNSQLQAISKTRIEFSSRNDVQKKLLKQISDNVEKLLSAFLHNWFYIVQDTELNSAQVEFLSDIEVKVGSKPKVHLTNTKITTVYDQPDIAGRLLILGEPGVGKTTMLLKLAKELVNRAKNDPTHPIPVLFSLSSWKQDNQSIKDWLVDQLKDKYGVRKDIGKGLVDNQQIIPLLDGLDELAAERQKKCVVKINGFLHPRNWTYPVVVCSRIEEYQRSQTSLQLNNSLELCSFTEEQVRQYLQDTKNLELWNDISQDEDLKQLAQIPLILNIIIISKISVTTWQQFQSSESRLSYLFETYITRMFERKYKYKQPKQENTKRWLGWLAQQLIEENQTEFLIEGIQPTWLKKKSQKVVYNLIVWGVIGGLIFWLIFWLTSYLFDGLIFSLFSAQYQVQALTIGLTLGLIYGLINGLIGEFIENKIQKTVVLINPLKNLNKTIIKRLILWLTLGLIYGLINGLTNEQIPGLIYGLITGLIAGLIVGMTLGLIGDEIQAIETLNFSLNKFLFGLIYGLIFWLIIAMISRQNNWQIPGVISGVISGVLFGVNGLEIENKTTPKQGIRQSVINTIILWFGTSLPFTLLSFISLKIAPKMTQNEISFNELLISSFVSGLFFGMVVGITRSGTPAIKHFVLRVILWSSGYIPWNYAKFLNYCTDGLFLQRVGGGYRFMHDLLRQHFAESYAEIQKRS